MSQEPELVDRYGGHCASCGARVLWATTAEGKRMPLDPRPSEAAGNVTAVVTRGRLISTVLTKRHAARLRATRAQPLYLSHFATCPQADQHRRKGKTR